MYRLAVMGSTRGTHLLNLVEAIRQKRLHASIELVLSDKSDALILERGRQHQLRTEFVDPSGLSRDAFGETLSGLIRQHAVDLIVLVGFMRILSAAFTQEWNDKIINIHPSLLPDFAGLMNDGVHESVLKSGKKETGCTVHKVVEKVDAGEILLQKKCVVLPSDTVSVLKARVQHLEAEALIEAIRLLQQQKRTT